MKIAVFGRTELRCSICVLLLVPAAAVLGKLPALMLALVSLAVHELSHAFMAARLGLVVSSIEVQPFGFIAELHTPPRTPSECLSVAAAGPFASLLIALCGAGLGKYIGHTSAAFQDFCSFNLSLGLMNLLPFLPLDGGRLALALIEKRIGRARAQRTLSLFGIIFGILLFCAGVLLVSATDAAFNPTPLAAGFFIFISALSEFRCSCGTNIKASLAGLSRLRSGSAVRVVPIALRSDCTVRKALSFIGGRGYGIIFVVEAGATVGILDENIVLNAALRGENDAELSTLLPRHSASSAPNLPVFKR